MSDIVKLPTIGEIYANEGQILKNSALAVILNAEPLPAWVRVHPITKFRYIPIEIVEYLLTRIFSRWRVEILDTKVIANSVAVTVRLHYLDPITGLWDWTDGIGASPMQTNQGAGATDFNQIKSAAVMMAAPAAETFAVKDAAEKLGKIFGKDLNRKDSQAYESLGEIAVRRFTKTEERTAALIQDAETVEDLKKVEPFVTDATYDLFTAKNNEING